MAASGRIRRRLALAIVLTALIPLLVAIWLADTAVRRTSRRLYQPELGARLDQALGLYQELARSVKTSMRYEAAAIAAETALRRAAVQGDATAVRRELERALAEYPNLVSLTVDDAKGRRLASVNRGKPFDPTKENKLEVTRPLADAEPSGESVPPDDEADPENTEASGIPQLVAVFAADKARFEELDEMSQFVDTYRKIERGKDSIETADVYAFAGLLGITILAAI